jgi:hypothetical protein
MKKVFLLLFIGVALIAGKAKAQYCDSTVTLDYSLSSYSAGTNVLDTFSWYVTADGWLNYTLTDTGPGGPIDEYESNLYIAYGYGFGSTGQHLSIIHAGGGNISGSLYIGTAMQFIYVVQGAGWINGPNCYEAQYWGDVLVSF